MAGWSEYAASPEFAGEADSATREAKRVNWFADNVAKTLFTEGADDATVGKFREAFDAKTRPSVLERTKSAALGVIGKLGVSGQDTTGAPMSTAAADSGLIPSGVVEPATVPIPGSVMSGFPDVPRKIVADPVARSGSFKADSAAQRVADDAAAADTARLAQPGGVVAGPAPGATGDPFKLSAIQTAGAIGKQIHDQPTHLQAAGGGFYQGMDASAPEWVKTARAASKALTLAGAPAGKGDYATTIPGLSLGEIASLGPSVAFSVVSLGSSAIAGAIGRVMGAAGGAAGAKAASFASTAGASYWSGFRMAANQFQTDWREHLDQIRKSNKVGPITDEEWNNARAWWGDLATAYGHYEGAGEAVGNTAELAIFRAAVRSRLGRLFGKATTTRFLSKTALGLGLENLSEAGTQLGQSDVEAQAGMGGERRSFTSPEDWWQSAREVAGVTTAQTVLTAGVLGAGHQIRRRATGQNIQDAADAKTAAETEAATAAARVARNDAITKWRDEGLSTGRKVPPPAPPAAPAAPPAGAAPAPSPAPAPAPQPTVYAEDMPDLSKQNRDRERAASRTQIAAIAGNPDFERAGISNSSELGAPMASVKGSADQAIPPAQTGRAETVIFPDGSKVPARYAVVEADSVLASNRVDGSSVLEYGNPPAGSIVALNNARTIGITEGYKRGTANNYRAQLVAAAPGLELDPAVIAAMKAPLLVRVYDDKINANKDLGRLSNASHALGTSSAERAMNDGRLLDVSKLSRTEGDVLHADNDALIRSFLESVPANERADLIAADGSYTKQLRTRVEDALVARAYRSPEIVSLAVETADPEIGNVLRAMREAAPAWARLPAMGDLDLRTPLVHGAWALVDAKARGMKPSEVLRQADLLGADPMQTAFTRLFVENVRSPKRMAARLQAIAEAAEVELSNRASMFAVAPRSKEQILEQATATAAPATRAQKLSGRGQAAPDNGGGPREGERAAGQRATPERPVQEVTDLPLAARVARATEQATGGMFGEEPAPPAKPAPAAPAAPAVFGLKSHTPAEIRAAAAAKEQAAKAAAKPAPATGPAVKVDQTDLFATQATMFPAGTRSPGVPAAPAPVEAVAAKPATVQRGQSPPGGAKYERPASGMPPKGKPLVLMFGGTYNPVQTGHVQAAEEAKQYAEAQGYTVQAVVMAPVGQKLADAKTQAKGEPSVSLAHRAAMLNLAVAGHAGIEVAAGPGTEADNWVGKLKRTQLADWGAAHYPGATIVNITGEDQAVGHPPGFPSIYMGDVDTSHDGYYYLAMARSDEQMAAKSSSVARREMLQGRPAPAGVLVPAVEAYYRDKVLKPAGIKPAPKRIELAHAGNIVVNGKEYPLTWQLPKTPRTLAADDPLMRDTFPAHAPHAALFDTAYPESLAAERGAWRQSVLDHVLGQVTPPGRKPILWVMAGGGGSGKGYVMGKLQEHGVLPVKRHNVVFVDADNIKMQAPEWDLFAAAKDGRGGSRLHEESSALAKLIVETARGKGLDVVFDATMANVGKGLGVLQAWRDAGYEIRVHGVATDPQTAVIRAYNRALENNRWVPWGEVLLAHKALAADFQRYAGIADELSLWDGNGADPFLVARNAVTPDGIDVTDKQAYNWWRRDGENIQVTTANAKEFNDGTKTLYDVLGGISEGHRQDRQQGIFGEPRGPSISESGVRTYQAGRGIGEPGDTEVRPPETSPGQPPAVQTGVSDEQLPGNGPTGIAGSEPAAVPGNGEVGPTGAVGGPVRGGNGATGNGPVDAGPREGEQPAAPATPGDVHPTAEPGAGIGVLGNAPVSGPEIPTKSGRNYYFSRPTDLSYEGGWLTKARQNVAAVKLVKELATAGRQATPDEQAILGQYTGWGASELANGIFGTKMQAADKLRATIEKNKRWRSPTHSESETLKVFDTSWGKLYDEVKALLTPEEWKEAAASTQFAHWTSKDVVRSMWAGAQRLGFHGGTVLEPGAGIGVFPGLMPAGIAVNSAYTGIELDPIAGAMLKQLMPDERIRVESYFDSKLPHDFYDVAIGNWPFANWRVIADPEYKRNGFLLHDYFFAKTMDRIKPGGLMIAVTSHGTMDKGNAAARQYLAERADLIGAVRLPQTAFKKNAGTEVVTDVLFLRKKVAGTEFAQAQPWAELREVQTTEGPAIVNEYFVAHPEMVLGSHSLQGSMRKALEYTVLPREGNIADHFAAAVATLPENVFAAQAGSAAGNMQTLVRDLDPANKKEGAFYLSKAGVLMLTHAGIGQRAEVQDQVIKDYVPLRDAVKQAHLDQLNDGDWEKSRKAMLAEYKRFVAKNGRLMANTPYTRTVIEEDPITGEDREVERKYRRWKHLPKFQTDPEFVFVRALERLNEETDQITDAPILHERVLMAPKVPEIRTPQDAMLHVLNETGRVDMPAIAAKMGLTEAQTVDALGDAVWKTPAGTYQVADQYLSGNVRKKLSEAEAAAAVDRRFEKNVAVLRTVLPSNLTFDQIDAELGMSWIPSEHYQEFMASEAGVPGVTSTYNKAGGIWTVDKGNAWTEDHNSKYATVATVPASLVLEHALNKAPLLVMDTIRERGQPVRHVLNPELTATANAALDAMRHDFKTWLWSDDKRRATLVEHYNENFNTTVARQFDGRHLTLPGTALKYGGGAIFDHVKRAIWRIIQDGNTYLAHAVGAGKTIEMVASAMEQKRLGLLRKPMFIVPRHMLQQIAQEWLDLYPTARLMLADENGFHTSKRREWVGRVALSDLDGVVMTHSSFKLLDLDPAFKVKLIEQQLDEFRAALAEAGGTEAQPTGRVTSTGKPAMAYSQDPTVKQIQATIERLKQRLTAAASSVGKDQGAMFSDLGVDMLYVDEAHLYRKLEFATQRKVKGLDPNGSDRAFDLWMKTRWLDERNPGRSLVMASGTPVTNTIAELYTVKRYMAPQLLHEKGLSRFDDWATMFGREQTEVEPTVSGDYENVTRFTSFVNVPEMTQMFRSFADVLTSDDLAKKLGDRRPKVFNGARAIHIAETNSYNEYKPVLKARVDASKAFRRSFAQPHNPDPVIAIIGDGRLAAMDVRYMEPSAPNDPQSKLNVLADGVIADYHKSANIEYQTRDRKALSPLKGGTQMVFADLGFGEGVTVKHGFDGRAWFTKRLIQGGIKPSEIAFMADHKTGLKKQALFTAVNDGKIKVLVGTTISMGVGTNAQNRLFAEHHMDVPWYPADLEQREGRIVRTGNQNPVVYLHAYSTKGSYDQTMWQMVAAKQRFIDQAMSGDPNLRTIEDLSPESDYAMAAAMTSDDPRMMQLAGLRGELKKLQLLHRGFEQTADRAEQDKRLNDAQIQRIEGRQLPQAKALAAKVDDLTGDKFKAKVGAVEFTKRKEWGDAILAELKRLYDAITPNAQQIGSISGFPLYFRGNLNKRDDGKITYNADVGLVIAEADRSYWMADGTGTDPVGMSIRATNVVADLAKEPAHLEEQLKGLRDHNAAIEGKIGGKSPYLRELLDKQSEVDELEAALLGGTTAAADAPTFDQFRWTMAGDLSGAAAMAARGTTLPTPIAHEETTRLANLLVGSWAVKPKLVVMRTIDQAPPEVRDYFAPLDAKTSQGPVAAFFWKDTVYVNAAAMGSRQDVIRYVQHEGLGHFGLRQTYGQEGIGKILNELLLIRRADIKAKAAAYGLAWDDPAQRSIAAEEYLVEMAETRPTLGFVKQAIAAIRTWARQHIPGFDNLKVTDAEIIREWILPARRRIEQGRAGQAPGSLVKQLRSAGPVEITARAAAARAIPPMPDLEYPKGPGVRQKQYAEAMKDWRAGIAQAVVGEDAVAIKGPDNRIRLVTANAHYGQVEGSRAWRVTVLDQAMQPEYHSEYDSMPEAVEGAAWSVRHDTKQTKFEQIPVAARMLRMASLADEKGYTALDRKIIDYKPDRTLSDPRDTRQIADTIGNARFVPYSQTPFFDRLNALMGVPDPANIPIGDYIDARYKFFNGLPAITAPLDKLVVTQDVVNKQRIAEMMVKLPKGGGGAPIQAVRYGGETYILDGHHRVVAMDKRGDTGVPARLLNLDMPLAEVPRAARAKGLTELMADMFSEPRVPMAKPANVGDPAGNVDHPLIFSSGMSRASDFGPALGANHSIGVDIGEVSANAAAQMAQGMAHSSAFLYVDSGAFALFRAGQRAARVKDAKGITPLNFNQVFARYDRLAEAISKADPSGYASDRVWYTMPDVVGDQRASLDLLKRFKDHTSDYVTYMQTVVPVQAGELSLTQYYDAAAKIIGRPDLTIGIPSAAAAVSNEDFAALLADRGQDLWGVHILGAASEKTAGARLEVLRAAGWDGHVSLDANRLRGLWNTHTSRAEAKDRLVAGLPAKREGEPLGVGLRATVVHNPAAELAHAREVLASLKAGGVSMRSPTAVRLRRQIAELSPGVPLAARVVHGEVPQAISSAATSRKQVPAAMHKIPWVKGTMNVDIGAGRFSDATEFLAKQGVRNVEFDPFNRTADENFQALTGITGNGGVDTTTVLNVLNVIKEPSSRDNVIRRAAKATRSNGTAYFQTYEGNASGNGAQTRDGWQENRKTESYVLEIKAHFGNVVRRGVVIEATHPIKKPGDTWVAPDGGILFARAATAGAAPALTPSHGILDTALRVPMQALQIDRATQATWDLVTSLAGKAIPERVKAGMVSDYGLPEDVTDRREVMETGLAKGVRQSQSVLDRIATLTRAETRALYQAANTADGHLVDYYIKDLPAESQAVLSEVKALVRDLGQQQVNLGFLDPEVFKRNEWSYLHRSYLDKEADQTDREKSQRASHRRLLVSAYLGRGIADAVPAAALERVAPDWWGRKFPKGKATPDLIGENFVRMELRDPPLPGMTGRGKLKDVVYYPAGEKLPTELNPYVRDADGAIWTIRDVKGADAIMRRDFTPAEREHMGEIDDFRYAVAKTLHLAINNVELGKFLKYLADHHSKVLPPPGAITREGKDQGFARYGAWGKNEWAQVPTTTLPGTGIPRYGALAGRWLPGAIWNEARGVVTWQRSIMPEWYQSMLRGWKISKTALSPTVHMNNIVSNFVFADWANVDARHVAQAASALLHQKSDAAASALVMDYQDNGGQAGTWALTDLQRQQLEPILAELLASAGPQGPRPLVGVLAALQKARAGEFEDAWQAFKGGKGITASQAAARKMIAFYQGEDDLFRLAAFIKGRADGLSDHDAGKFARNAFLDYRINAPWVQFMRQTLFPFISFTYRALPLMLNTAAQQPWKPLKLLGVLGALNALAYMMLGGDDGDEDKERKWLPEEKAGRVWGVGPNKLMRLPWNDAGAPVFLDVRRFIPIGDFFDTGQNHAAMAWLPAAIPSGPLATFAELMANRSQFTGRDITVPNIHGVGGDTPMQATVKIADHLFKSFAPNIMLPGPGSLIPGIDRGQLETYSYQNVLDALHGRTDVFGRDVSLPQALVGGVGIKVGSYSREAAALRLKVEVGKARQQISAEITAAAREYARHGITREEFDRRVAGDQAKMRALGDMIRERAP